MFTGVLNPLVISHVFNARQVRTLEFDFIVSLSYLIKLKFHIFFCVTLEQLFHVLGIITVSRNTFLNIILVPIFSCKLLTLFSHLK